eukprot:CAMPEP_0204375324 /NCGR_PEP_ID=MMETSP0469-20131031/49140_1 /ASSEMBLY_ACC=CAM_ASM_000384 /TAXON_ID=2969 /ORGANISM="Oxyrrhis marina" /LENGTH=319 /DNA_ID=CAMNT_0051365989 /DNA_START=51 /DNA_END=1010 /DNA_ORIENTATION=-
MSHVIDLGAMYDGFNSYLSQHGAEGMTPAELVAAMEQEQYGGWGYTEDAADGWNWGAEEGSWTAQQQLLMNIEMELAQAQMAQAQAEYELTTTRLQMLEMELAKGRRGEGAVATRVIDHPQRWAVRVQPVEPLAWRPAELVISSPQGQRGSPQKRGKIASVSTPSTAASSPVKSDGTPSGFRRISSESGENAAHTTQPQGTTVMLRNIPNRYTQEMLMKELDSHGMASKYDFCYLPIDVRNSKNVGYAFVNCSDEDSTGAFYTLFTGYKFQQFPSRKIAQVCQAHIQGIDNLKEHFGTKREGGDDRRVAPGSRPFIRQA